MIRYLEVFGTENQMSELKTLTRNFKSVKTTIIEQDKYYPRGRIMEFYYLKMVGDDQELKKLLKLIGDQSFKI